MRRISVVGRVAVAALLTSCTVICSGCDDPSALKTARSHKAVKPWADPPHGFKIEGNQEAADAAIPCLPGLRSIDSIKISKVDLSVEHLKTIGQKTSIVTLALNECGLSDRDLEHLAGLKNVKTLQLRQNPIRGEGLVHLRGMQSVVSLDLDGTQISGPGLQEIGSLPKLFELKLNGTLLDDRGVKPLVDSRSRVQTLWVTGTKITVDGYLQLANLLWLTGPFYSDDFVGPEDDSSARIHARRELGKKFRAAQLEAIEGAVKRGEVAPTSSKTPGGDK